MALSVALGCALVATLGVSAAAWIKSPAQVAAETRAPDPSSLTATVEQRAISSSVVTRGTTGAVHRLEVIPRVPEGADAAVVSGLNVTAGAAIKPGKVLLEISGRPLIALRGSTPAYRDLRPDDEGDDVAALQKALRDLGHYSNGDRSGRFGSATKDAVSRLYKAVGYRTPSTSGPRGTEEEADLRAAEDAVDNAQRAVEEMRRRTRSGSPQGAEKTDLDAQLTSLQRSLDRARSARASLIARTGPMVPRAEVVFVPTFPARVARLPVSIGDEVKGPVLVLTAGALSVTAKVRPADATLLKPGMPVDLLAESIGSEQQGHILTIGAITTAQDSAESAEGEGAAPASAPFVPVVVQPDKPLSSAWTDQELRVTITAARTSNDVLVVPLSAVSSGADGRTRISRVEAGDHLNRLEVRTGVSGDGYVEVSPVDGELKPGDLVAVGE
ncbi:peptidoglycan-binding protein [Micromonospora sp. NPDC047644]|uniref:peptidoglycan-binding protein n=1 Tax=Micromonospora sp. NPDC047644 TaxID=3157203 RepID=UPI003453930B